MCLIFLRLLCYGCVVWVVVFSMLSAAGSAVNRSAVVEIYTLVIFAESKGGVLRLFQCRRSLFL